MPKLVIIDLSLKDYNQNKEIILDYIEEVNKSNKDVKTITNYSLSIDNIKDDLEDNHNTIDKLNKKIKKQNLEIKHLKSELEDKDEVIFEKDKQISFLKLKIDDLREKLDYFKEKFRRLIDFLHDRILGIFGEKDSEVYKDVSTNLFAHKIINEEEYDDIISKKNKHRNDLER